MTPLVITAYGRNTLRRLRSELLLIDPSATPRLAAAWELDPVSPTPNLVTGDLPDISLADLAAVSALPAAAVLCALDDVAATLDAAHGSGLAHGELRASTVYVLPDGRAALAQPEAARAVKRNGRGRARQEDCHAFVTLAAELLTGAPEAAATVLEDALKVDISRRPVPRALMDALDEIPAEDWPTNNLQRPRADAAPVIRLGSWPASMPATFSTLPDAPAAAAASPVRFIPDGVEERQRQQPPHRDRSLLRRLMEPLVVLVGLATVAAGGAGGAFLLLSPSSSAGDPGATRPQVRRVALSITPPQAQCPRAAMHVAATIVISGGAGEVVVRWRLPDGSLADTQSFSVYDGQRSVRAAFDMTFAGTDPVLGNVVAIVSPGGMRASAPIRYVCPSSNRKGFEQSRDA